MRTSPLSAPFLVCTLALTVPHLWAAEAEPNAKTTAYQTSVAQEQMRGSAKRLKEEMLSLLGEFSEYRSAAPDLARLKEATEQLDTSSQAEMLAVVQTLREASRTDDAESTRGKILLASGEQKNIQALLRKLADRLILQKDAAAMQQRIKALALRQVTNLRMEKDLAASGAKPDKVPWELQNRQAVAKTEQQALHEEVKMAMETLTKLAENPEAAKDDTFKDALAAAKKQGLEEQAKEAAEKNKTDFTEAAKAATAVSEGLKNMLQDLQKNQSKAEQTEALAQELKELAQDQERLAKETSRAFNGQEQALRKEQQQISNKLDVAQKAVAKLNPEASAQTTQAQEKSDQVADSLKGQALNKVDNVAKTADAQSAVAKQLSAASEMLQKQADALAGNSPDASPDSSTPQSPAEAAIGEAVKQVMDAKSQIATAERQLRADEDPTAGKQRLAQAEGALQKAEEKAAEAAADGAAVDKSVGEELKAAEANAGKADQAAGQGSKEDQERSRWNLDKAQGNANKALAGLQKAANDLAAKAGEGPGKTAAGDQPGKDGKEGKEGKGKAMTSRSDKGGADSIGGGSGTTDFSALAKLQSGQREALSLLKTEKAPSEYEAMVKQYVRNLAESDATAP